MEVHLKIIGILLMVLGSIHIFFPKYFNWKEELKSLSLINRQMMTVHTFFIALVVFLVGLLCFIASTELVQTKLGKIISFGLGIFWATRLIFQLFIYSSKLWKGRKFETTIHVMFTLLWTYFTGIFLWIATN
jgi:membrane protein YdbS with pleckstrin-like domain